MKLCNPSSIAQQQKLEIIRTKFEIAAQAPEETLDEYSQRGSNAHPEGKSISDGGCPGIARSRCEPLPEIRGTELSRPSV